MGAGAGSGAAAMCDRPYARGALWELFDFSFG